MTSFTSKKGILFFLLILLLIAAVSQEKDLCCRTTMSSESFRVHARKLLAWSFNMGHGHCRSLRQF